MINKSNPESFVWPEFNDDKERIKAYSKKYKNMSIAEAFADAYGIKLDSVKESANDVPRDLVKGDVLKLNILNIAKNKVDFEQELEKNKNYLHLPCFIQKIFVFSQQENGRRYGSNRRKIYQSTH